MENLQIFKNNKFGEVRTVVIDNEPWFVGKDIADNLGYQNGSRDINRHVDENDRVKQKISDGRQLKETILINESGMYALIFGSKLETAREFKHWVTSEILPTIRKHGAYITSDTMANIISNPEFGIKLLSELKKEQDKNKRYKSIMEFQHEELKKKELEIAVQSQQLAEAKPKASYCDVVLNCKDLISTSVIAKDYGWSAKRMNKELHSRNIQYKQGDVWLLYAKYQGEGYTNTKTHTYNKPNGTQGANVHTYWTQKGRLFIYEMLKKDNILPLIELER